MADALFAESKPILLKEKKSVNWVHDDKIEEVFHFEHDEIEREFSRWQRYLQFLKGLESYEMLENKEGRTAILGIKFDKLELMPKVRVFCQRNMRKPFYAGPIAESTELTKDENVQYESEAFYLRRIVDWIERGNKIVYCVPTWSGDISPSSVGYLPIGLSENWNSEILHHCVYIYTILTFNKIGVKTIKRYMSALHFLLEYTKEQQFSTLLEEQGHRERMQLIFSAKNFSKKFEENRKVAKTLMNKLHNLFIGAVVNGTNHESDLKIITFEEVVNQCMKYNENMLNCRKALDDFFKNADKYIHILENACGSKYESSRICTNPSLTHQN